MPAPKGHPRWGNPLNPKKYTPEKLWDKALEYFDWADENPYMKLEQKKGSTNIPKSVDLSQIKNINEMFSPIVEIPTKRPYTLIGFCVFANISHHTFCSYEKETETFLPICNAIREIVEENMFEGGLVGAYEKVLVARKLGLVEKHDITSDGESINAIIVDGRSKNV
jgi:DNA-packaging protein gp3